jgi:hypothetical protein
MSLLMRRTFGASEDDARLIRLQELRHKAEGARKSKSDGLTAGEVGEYRSLTHELVMEQVERLRQGPPRGVVRCADEKSFRAIPLRERAKEAGVDENDPLLLWALEAQEKAADWRISGSWMEMEAAVLGFLEAHFEFKNAWPPNAREIEMALWKVQSCVATDTEIQEFRLLADEVFRKWEPQWPPAFKKRIESALNFCESTVMARTFVIFRLAIEQHLSKSEWGWIGGFS